MQRGEQIQESWLLETRLFDRFFLNAETYSFSRVEFEYDRGVPMNCELENHVESYFH